MENIIAESLVHRALREYDQVHEELQRPREDLVLIATFELIRNAISEFLTAYLFEKGVKAYPGDNILHLQAQCTELNKAFAELDLKYISHYSDHQNAMFTQAVDDGRLHKCIRTLDLTKELVLNLLDANED